jgi:HEAT repeat protein
VILLGRQRVREAAGPIAALLADPKSCPPNLASLAIVALGRIGDKSAVPAIKPYLDVSEPVGLLEENRRFEVHWGVRTNAARALAQLGDLSGVPVLVELLEADQSRLRNYAQRLLEEITSQHFGKDRQAWQRWWQQRQASDGR